MCAPVKSEWAKLMNHGMTENYFIVENGVICKNYVIILLMYTISGTLL